MSTTISLDSPLPAYTQILMPSPNLLASPLRSRHTPIMSRWQSGSSGRQDRHSNTTPSAQYGMIPSSSPYGCASPRLSPYMSPSNPFSTMRSARCTAASVPFSKQLSNVIQHIVAFTPSAHTRSPGHVMRKGWKSFDEPTSLSSDIVDRAKKTVFWILVIVFVSAIAGIGGSADSAGGVVDVRETRIWSRPVPLPSGIETLGWKGIEMREGVETIAMNVGKRSTVMDHGDRLLQGIWEFEQPIGR